MPDLKNLVTAELRSQHWISNNITERRQLKEEWRQPEKVYLCRETNQELQRLAVSDSLTQVANRHRFEAYLDQEWRRMAREQVALSLILGDLDFFKAYNDSYGYQAGDKCLQQVAQVIVSTLKRPADLVARYGGEEFVVILPNTKAEGAVRVAEEIRSRLKALEIAHTNSQISKYLTLSLGVASIIPSHEYSSALLITAADQALYEAKAQGRDRVILHENLLRQTKVVEQEKPPALQPSKECTLVPVSGKKIGAATKTELLMSYVAYYVSRGKSVISPVSGSLSFEGSVYQYWGYHRDFQDFWRQLQQRCDFRDLYIKGDNYGFGQYLDGNCSVGECARCNLPVPKSLGNVCQVSNCNLCNDHWNWEKGNAQPARCPNADPESQNFEDELGLTRVVAIGAPPTDYKNLEEWFSLNGFEVTFVSKPEEVTPQSFPSPVDLVLILAEVSEAEGKAWAQELNRHPQFEGVPIVGLSAEAGHGLPWMERTLGIEDYVLTPYSGDRLAHHLRQVIKPQLNTDTVDLYWFPR